MFPYKARFIPASSSSEQWGVVGKIWGVLFARQKNKRAQYLVRSSRFQAIVEPPNGSKKRKTENVQWEVRLSADAAETISTVVTSEPFYEKCAFINSQMFCFYQGKDNFNICPHHHYFSQERVYLICKYCYKRIGDLEIHNCSFGSECYGNIIDFDVQGLRNIQITALSTHMVFINLKK